MHIWGVLSYLNLKYMYIPATCNLKICSKSMFTFISTDSLIRKNKVLELGLFILNSSNISELSTSASVSDSLEFHIHLSNIDSIMISWPLYYTVIFESVQSPLGLGWITVTALPPPNSCKVKQWYQGCAWALTWCYFLDGQCTTNANLDGFAWGTDLLLQSHITILKHTK